MGELIVWTGGNFQFSMSSVFVKRSADSQTVGSAASTMRLSSQALSTLNVSCCSFLAHSK